MKIIKFDSPGHPEPRPGVWKRPAGIRSHFPASGRHPAKSGAATSLLDIPPHFGFTSAYGRIHMFCMR